MKFIVTMTCDNAAFNEDDAVEGGSGAARGAEIARILRKVATDVEDGTEPGDAGLAFDANGNKVGTWELQAS